MTTATDMGVTFEADKLGMFGANHDSMTANQEKIDFTPQAQQQGLVQKVEFADAELLQGMDEMTMPQPDDALGLSTACEMVSNELHGLNGQSMAPAMQPQLQVQPPQPGAFGL